MTDQPTQPALLHQPSTTPIGPVECLGLTFASDAERRTHFTALLADKLKDPEFRNVEGFPIGKDEDILALSDPPYYTACPNPWIAHFIERFGEPYDPEVPYNSEPFADDVSEGKNDPIYNAHAYPTKVPPGAIEPFMKHYVGTGRAIVLDPFAGSGMTGVAIGRTNHSANGILCDISPAAAHIAASIQGVFDVNKFQTIAELMIDEAEDRYGWMYSSRIKGGESQVRYYVWSDVYTCDSCSLPVRIWDIEGEKSVGGLKPGFRTLKTE